MSKQGCKTQSHQVSELDVPLGVILINLFILQMRKLSVGEKTYQEDMLSPTPNLGALISSLVLTWLHTLPP